MKLLLMPGLDGTGLLFRPLLRALPPGLEGRVVSYPPDEPRGYPELLPLAEEAAAECGEFVAVGESFSGPLTLMLADRRPPGLRGVVLCASFVTFPIRQLPKSWRTMVHPWMFRFRPFGPVAWALLGRHRRGEPARLLRRVAAAATAETMAARALSVAGLDARRELRDCPVPVMYLRAAEDRVVWPWCSELVKEVRPDAEVVELPGPHLIMQVNPKASAGVLESFCKRVAECRPASRQGLGTSGSLIDATT